MSSAISACALNVAACVLVTLLPGSTPVRGQPAEPAPPGPSAGLRQGLWLPAGLAQGSVEPTERGLWLRLGLAGGESLDIPLTLDPWASGACETAPVPSADGVGLWWVTSPGRAPLVAELRVEARLWRYDPEAGCLSAAPLFGPHPGARPREIDGVDSYRHVERLEVAVDLDPREGAERIVVDLGGVRVTGADGAVLGELVREPMELERGAYDDLRMTVSSLSLLPDGQTHFTVEWEIADHPSEHSYEDEATYRLAWRPDAGRLVERAHRLAQLRERPAGFFDEVVRADDDSRCPAADGGQLGRMAEDRAVVQSGQTELVQRVGDRRRIPGGPELIQQAESHDTTDVFVDVSNPECGFTSTGQRLDFEWRLNFADGTTRIAVQAHPTEPAIRIERVRLGSSP